MFGEPAAYRVYEHGTPISGVITLRRAYNKVIGLAGGAAALAAMRNKHDVYAIRQSLDGQDRKSLAKRQLNRDMLSDHGPLSGDIVVYPNDARHRISQELLDEPDGAAVEVQTSRGGSWHWAPSGHMSFSGSLCSPIPVNALTWTIGEHAGASAWFFHHEHRCAHNAVHVKAKVRVWHASVAEPN
jgi:hypothetical protein